MRAWVSAAGLLLGMSCGPAEVPTEEGRAAILFGERVQLGEYPAVGSLTRFNGTSSAGFCTSSLIAPDVLLTAAHCVPAPGEPGQDLRFSRELMAPFGDDFDNPLWTRVRGWVVHPDYRSGAQGRLEHDIAVVFLEQAVEGAEPTAIADESAAAAFVLGAPAVIVGYGRDATGLTGVLNKAKTTLSYAGPDELRFGGIAPNPSRCTGDSGGPAFMEFDDGRAPRRRVVSVNSYGAGSCDSASVEMRVDAHLAWLIGALGKACDDGARIASCAAARGPRLAGRAEAGDAGVAPSAAPAIARGDAGVVELPFEAWDGGCASTSAGSPSAGWVMLVAGVFAVAWRRSRG